MRVLVLGAGAIGGWFGARLIRAGTDVSFLVRAARAQQLARDGLRVHGRQFRFAAPVPVLTQARMPFDLILLTCKAWDLETAIAAIRPAVGAHTLVLPLLNGLRQLELLDAAFGAQQVLGGLAHISVTLDAQGAIEQLGTLERITYGTRERGAAVPAEIRAALLGLGAAALESADILAAMWDKFAFIASLAGITCLMRGSVGEILTHADGEVLIRRLYAECCAIAAGARQPISEAASAAALASLTAIGSPLKASMLRDLERGSRTECEHILGDLRARAVACAVDTPLLASALCQLRVHEAARAARA